ncbi:isocitrate lyase/PEP mutase family protein [Rhizobium rhizogenes]|uniref:isocitrate lyase/PEP mutase family protein n=1 Tax=Rhizobium rhizogenes TaxID=359 RepID=UPI0015741198|nr:isocitrate lyase/phosphoenolpyruvate mutase family protein [Rhizobium rhizogenes]NTI78525.1 hypothetical protein [Rhizobium rhizogenes]
MTKRTSFRQLFRDHHPVVSPIAHDALTARMITAAGFPAVCIGGSAMLAAQFGLPDMGIATLGEMVEGARVVMRGTHLPCGVDGDDGYGDLKSVARTVESYSELDVGSIIFEDQARGSKQPGDGRPVGVISTEDMCSKLQTAVYARSDKEQIILARVDAYAVEGLDGALRRADRYLNAGADGIFVSGLSSQSELEKVGRTLKGAIQIAVVSERLMNIWPSPKELYDLGFTQVMYPNLIIGRTVRGIERSIDDVRALARGEKANFDDLETGMSLGSLQSLLGRERWAEIDHRFAAAEPFMPAGPGIASVAPSAASKS